MCCGRKIRVAFDALNGWRAQADIPERMCIAQAWSPYVGQVLFELLDKDLPPCSVPGPNGTMTLFWRAKVRDLPEAQVTPATKHYGDGLVGSHGVNGAIDPDPFTFKREDGLVPSASGPLPAVQGMQPSLDATAIAQMSGPVDLKLRIALAALRDEEGAQARLMRECAVARCARDALQADRHDVAAMLDTAHEHIVTVERERDDLREQLTAANARLDTQKATIQDLQARLEEASSRTPSRFKALCDANAEQAQQIERGSRANDNQAVRIGELAEKLSTMTRERDDAHLTCERLRYEIEQDNKRNLDLASRCDRTQALLDETERGRLAVRQELADLKSQVRKVVGNA
ncbi:MAG: hypothetical protein WC700_09105 [Gemmatimonadaceae bacterium]